MVCRLAKVQVLAAHKLAKRQVLAKAQVLAAHKLAKAQVLAKVQVLAAHELAKVQVLAALAKRQVLNVQQQAHKLVLVVQQEEQAEVGYPQDLQLQHQIDPSGLGTLIRCSCHICGVRC